MSNTTSSGSNPGSLSHPVKPFKTIGLIGRLGSDKVVDSLQRLVRYLTEHDYKVLIKTAPPRRCPNTAYLKLAAACWVNCAI